MKTIFHTLPPVLSGALLLWLMPAAIKAEELSRQPSAQPNKAPVQAQSAAPSNSRGALPAFRASKTPSTILTMGSAQPASVSRQTQSGKSPSSSEKASNEMSPPFHVSADPRDQVQLSVHNGIVTVQGSVGSRELARKLVSQYAQMPGVRQIRNRLTVRTNNDARIAVQLREALSRAPDIRVGNIAVTVYDGIVFLSGAVSSAQESERAEKLAAAFQGVRKVNNALRVPGQNRYPTRLPTRATTYPRRR